MTKLYPVEGDGRRVFRGVRPGEAWIGHGTFRRSLLTWSDATWTRVVVYKQRWRHRVSGKTCHSRPPDDLASIWFCSLVVATALWGWLVAEEGLHRHQVIVAALAEAPSARTVQRWLQRAVARADETATALRRAVIERSEPRPMESHVRGGLSPPKRRWVEPGAVSRLRSGLFHLFEGANSLDMHVSVLLAEARGRQHAQETSWLI